LLWFKDKEPKVGWILLAACFANAALSSWEEAYSLGALLLLFVEKLT
jgi:hypothetical protein